MYQSNYYRLQNRSVKWGDWFMHTKLIIAGLNCFYLDVKSFQFRDGKLELFCAPLRLKSRHTRGCLTRKAQVG